MNLSNFLEKIIEDGIEAARADYIRPDQENLLKGSIQGFEGCRGKTPQELRDLYGEAMATSSRKSLEQADDYWYYQGRALEIEWVCNCISAVLVNEGQDPLLGHLPTCRGVFKAAEVIGMQG
jgi:hypothetical protein